MCTFKDNMFVENIEIIYKWGFDGVSGQKKYKHTVDIQMKIQKNFRMKKW